MFSNTTITENLLQGDAPWDLAPKKIASLAKAYEAAIEARFDAEANLDQARIDQMQADQAWEEEGLLNARENKGAPSSDNKDMARFKRVNAETDLKQAEKNVRDIVSAISGLLSESDDLRNEWMSNIAKQLEARQSDLSKLKDPVSSAVADIVTLNGYLPYLGEWGNHLRPPFESDFRVSVTLADLTTLKPWTPPKSQTTSEIYSPAGVVNGKPVDTRPNVFIVDMGGNVVELEARQAGTWQASYRLATPDEIARYQKRNPNRVQKVSDAEWNNYLEAQKAQG